MTISASHSKLSKPEGEERVSSSTKSYFAARNRYNIFNLIWDEFRKSGISQATLARRLGKKPEQINRMLRSPNNLEIDTVSNILFAIRGGEPRYEMRFPLEEHQRNSTGPDWPSASSKSAMDSKKNGNEVRPGGAVEAAFTPGQ